MEFDIKGNVLKSCKGTEQEITVPDGIQEIAKKAFYGLKMRKVTLPEGLEKIGDCAFENCMKLEEINLPDSLSKLGHTAFANAALRHVKIPAQITELGMKTFACCPKLESIEFPEGLTSIGTSAFVSCKNLLEVRFPESLQMVGQFAFLNCTSLRAVHMPKTLAVISIGAFDSTPKLKHVTMPEKMGFIGKEAFRKGHILHFPQPEGEICIEPDYQWTEQREEHLLLQFMQVTDLLFKEKLFTQLKSMHYKLPAALYMAVHHPETDAYAAYIRRNAQKAGKFYIDKNAVPEMEQLLSLQLVNKANTEKLIQYTIDTQKPELYTLLLHYKDEQFGFSKPSFRL